MLSHKWTFSLTSLFLFLALVFVAPSVMAGEFGVSLSISDAHDVSYEEGYQIERRRDSHADGLRTTILVKTDKVVNHLPNDAADDILSTGLHYKHFIAIAYNKFGGATVIENTQGSGTESGAQGTIPLFGSPADGKNFQFDFFLPRNAAADIVRIQIFLEKHKFEVADPAADLNDDGTRKDDGKNAAASIDFYYVFANGYHSSQPTVYQIRRPDDVLPPVTEATFDVIVTLSEEARKDTFTKDRFEISNATITEITDMGGFAQVDSDNDGTFEMSSTGRYDMIHKYLLTVTPNYENKDPIVIKINEWESQEKPGPEKYTAPATDAARTEGKDKLTVKVNKVNPGPTLTEGIEVVLNSADNAIIIPKDGYLIVAESKAGSAIVAPATAEDKSPDKTKDGPAQLKYKIIERDGLPNLQTHLTNGVVMDVVAPKGLVVSEVMWGEDSSLADPSDSQWIELMNTSGEELTLAKGGKDYKLVFYRHGETVGAVSPASGTTPAALPAGVTDRIGTMVDGTGKSYWSPAGRGRGGRTGEGEAAKEFAAIVETQSIISMYRVADAITGKVDPTTGTSMTMWMQSSPPSANFDPGKSGVRVGTPGSAHIITAGQQKMLDDAAAEKKKQEAADAAKAADTSVMMPKVGQIYISEIMFAGGGTLPQWIEISNGSRSEQVNLSGWTITVDNAAADADVSVGATATFTIPDGTKIDPSGQHDTPSTLLVVTERGRNSLTGAMASGQVLNLAQDNEVELILAGVVTGKYTLLSGEAFLITLAPPEPEATTPPAGETKTAKATRQAAEKKAANERKAATDMVGNLGTDGAAAWALEMNAEGGRSSIVRRHIQVARGPAAPEDGMMAKNWTLASETSFAQVTHIRAKSYYGAANDEGTPGFRAGGALPVELSHFRPVRDKATGQVVITWSTQSELNNAGFFIKRSQQHDGEFQVINATMVPGAGTTSEKQFYTYSDTTAQPNVVYYYQIEEVSLDGQRQLLTRGIRLKGHVGAAGKATTTWGDLKTHE